MKLSLYGQPLVKSSTSAHAQAIPLTAAASSTSATSTDANATVDALQAALAARGVTANVTAQVMDGTTLHQIVMGENNGLPPTPDQFKTDPSGYLIVNFQLDDMITSGSDPAQAAAATQFADDLTVFSQRATVSGKLVYAVLPLPKCNDPNDSARNVLIGSIVQAQRKSMLNTMGGIPFCQGTDNYCAAWVAANHGAQCSTPEADLETMRTNSIADYVAALYKESTAPAAASGASATGT
ncbi:hypothetical protein ACXIVK_23965 [Paraburkholderia caledonica]